ncbi:MAG: nitrite/sulfite reductase, partial [Coprococcus sp.]
TCQTIQLHDLDSDTICSIIDEALNVGIVTMGGGGDYPRNVMCSPLSGVEKGEYFDVLPWAEAAGDYLLTFLKTPKMPRKLKVGFSNSAANLTHATYRDLGFAARKDGLFDVYSAGGLGKNPLFGVKVAEAVEPSMILYYIKAMWLTFITWGNYENRGKARTRYMQEALGGPEKYAEAYQKKLAEVMASGEDLRIDPETLSISQPVGLQNNSIKGTVLSHPRIIEQKQPGLYTVCWHPIGGQPDPDSFCRLADTLEQMENAEIRLAPDQTAYIINLTEAEAERVLDITSGGAETPFEASVSCIGASICQIGLRDSQALLSSCIQAVRQADIPGNALPQMHISGCPSSCGTHQTGIIGFRGAGKFINGRSEPGYMLYLGGNEHQGKETIGKELGIILENDIPKFLVNLGRTVSESSMDFMSWYKENMDELEEIADKYICR